MKKSYIKNAIGHFKTITRHRHAVMRHCLRAGILWQGIRHDLSKYTPAEFIQGARYYTGTRSPNEAERHENGYSKAWLHHKGRNKHHFEYWIDYASDGEGNLAGMKMPDKYIIEMFMDRIAASKVYMKEKYTDRSPLEYYNWGKGRVILHEHTRKLLEQCLEMLAEQGEEKTFSYIKREVLKK